MAPILTGSRFGFGGGGGGAAAADPGIRDFDIYVWGSKGGSGRGGAPQPGGWSFISGTVPVGTKIGYIVGQSNVSTPQNFFTGGPGGGPVAGGGFSAVFLGGPATLGVTPSSPTWPNARPYTLCVSGGAGGGGGDGYTSARGGYGGGAGGGDASPIEDPSLGFGGFGGSSVAGGSGGPAPINGLSGFQWYGGNGGAGGQDSGGGGGGWYGGGSGGSNSSYDAGGGGGSGYVAPLTTYTNADGSITLTNAATYTGPTGTVPSAIGDTYGYPGTVGRVVIEINGVAVVNQGTGSPASAWDTYVVV